MMKTTKDYLLLSAAIAGGIIIGMSVMLLIGRSIQRDIMNERMEMASNFGLGFGPAMNFANSNYRGANRFNKRAINWGQKGQKNGKRNMRMMGGRGMQGNWQNGIPPVYNRLDLTDEQKKQIEAITEKSRERFRQMQELRESRWEASTEEIRDILTDEQLKKYDALMKRNGKKNHAPGYYFILNRFDLTDEQKEKVEALMERNKQMREGMWKSRKQEMQSTMDEIRSILTDEQKEKLDNMPMYKRRFSQK